MAKKKQTQQTNPSTSKSAASSSQNIQVNGILIEDSQTAPIEGFELVSTIDLRADRSGTAKPEFFDEEEFGVLTFEDGTEWIGYLGDMPEIFGESASTRSSSSQTFVLPTQLASTHQDRSGITNLIKAKFLNVFRKSGTALALNFVIKKIDEKIVSQAGLFLIDKSFNKSPVTEKTKLEGKVLLLLHGVLSHSASAFKGLKGDEDLFNRYDHVLVFDHYTLHEHPIENALALLKALPEQLEIDILSHSRGGLVGDVLSRADVRNDYLGFTADEIELLIAEGEVNKKDLEDFNEWSYKKQLKVINFVRVACPAAGTTLLSNRLDFYLNALLNSFGVIGGFNSDPVYKQIKELLLEVVNLKADAEAIPGVWAMTPSSSYQRVNNTRLIDVKSKLFVIAGNAEANWNVLKHGGQSLVVILSNLYFFEANDFAVDTKSMKKGMARAEGLYQYVSKSGFTNHFNYFDKDEKSREAVLLALQGITSHDTIQFEYLSKDQMDRGVGVALGLRRYHVDDISGEKDIAVLIPGIMGSTLQDTKSDIWVDILRIMGGDMIKRLKIDDPDISASGAISKYYEKMGVALRKTKDLRVFGFDWRKSLSDTAKVFSDLINDYLAHDKTITIVAHSMGGLLAKHFIFHYPEIWEKFKRNSQNKLIMLGTPWYGSHLIMEVLTGHGAKLKLLGNLDLKHKKSTILKEVAKYPGVLELLPITDSGFEDASIRKEKSDFEFRGYEDTSFWDFIRKYAKETVKPNEAFKNIIKYFKTKKNAEGVQYQDFKLSEDDISHIYYIAGYDDTVFGCRIKKSIFKGKHLVYLTTKLGDGSVTWDLGIPKEMLESSQESRVFYSTANHTKLASNKTVIETVMDIIANGESHRLSQERLLSRSGDLIKEVPDLDLIVDGDEEVLRVLMGDKLEAKPLGTKLSKPIKVSVFNADLKYARYPVMVGHFKNDGLFSAERALDKYMQGRLSERYRLGYYPEEIGESDVTYKSEMHPRGAMIVGLGKQSDLTAFQMALSVEKAVIRYAFFFRDNYQLEKNKKYAKGITAILMGTVYGGLPVEDCVQAILTGVQKANQYIEELDSGLVPIEHIEFIDYYEDKAEQSYLTLKRLATNIYQNNIIVQQLEKGIGSRKRSVMSDNASWWHTISTTTQFLPKSNQADGMEHHLSDGKARVEQSKVSSDLNVASYLTEQFSQENTWDHKLSKTLFELLIPNDFKSVIKNQNNIIWKLDEYAAQFPWEMFHDYNMDNRIPSFVNTGLIRQFITDHYRVNPSVVDQKKALVIGDPDYFNTSFGQLPGAAIEAKMVVKQLEKNQYDVASLINDNAGSILTELFADNYRMLHIAAHGVYELIEEGDTERVRAGVVLGDGLYLEPGTLNQLSSIPEFVFINCCYSGTIQTEDEKYYKNRHHLAANIGTQLIQMGVKAIVVTGWAVDDQAANLFAEVFYEKMFEGYEFGMAVKLARRACFEKYSSTNTWGAYQCYGDPYFKLTNKNPEIKESDPYISENQILIDLENMLSGLEGQCHSVDSQLKKLDLIRKQVDKVQGENAAILELYALIYNELGVFDQALSSFEALMNKETANFSFNSIRQFFNLKSRSLMEQTIEEKWTNVVARSSFKTLIVQAESIFDFGAIVDRVSLLAMMHRRMAVSLRTKKDKLLALSAMRKHYKTVLNITEHRGVVQLSCSLSNYIIANQMLEATEDYESYDDFEVIGFKDKDQDLTTALLNAIELIVEEEELMVSYDALASRSRLYAGLLFLNLNTDKAAGYFENYAQALKHAIDTYGNRKNILEEREYILFLKEFINKKHSIYNSLSVLDYELDIKLKS